MATSSRLPRSICIGPRISQLTKLRPQPFFPALDYPGFSRDETRHGKLYTQYVTMRFLGYADNCYASTFLREISNIAEEPGNKTARRAAQQMAMYGFTKADHSARFSFSRLPRLNPSISSNVPTSSTEQVHLVRDRSCVFCRPIGSDGHFVLLTAHHRHKARLVIWTLWSFNALSGDSKLPMCKYGIELSG